jgi:hypothetical protein
MEDYAVKFINNLPDHLMNTETPIRLDLVLEGGLFNGSYHVGVLFFLKEMEKRNIVKVERISGASIGALMGLLYFSNNLHLITDLYKLIYIDFKKTHCLKMITQLNEILRDKLPENMCEMLDKRLYICYYNVITGKKHVKKMYKNTYVLINTVIKSCFVPYLIDGNMLYKNKYIDGFTPHIFKRVKDKRILYVDLLGYDKLSRFYNIKNEKTNEHRVLAGLLDVHYFFIKQQYTNICSYVDNWNITHHFSYYLKILLEKVFVYIIILKVRFIPLKTESYAISKMSLKILSDMISLLLDTYCV